MYIEKRGGIIMNKMKKVLASVCAVTMLAQTALVSGGMQVDAFSERQLLGETSFDYKMVPWRTVEASPAKQDFELTGDGELHIRILSASGADREKWDLQLRHRNINFRAGHTYEVSFMARAKRDGMELCSKISNIKGDEEYVVLDGDEFHYGPHMGGEWATKPTELSTEWKTYKGEFTVTKDLEAVEWSFSYAKGSMYGGNAVDGDEIWFDEMSLCDVTDDVPVEPVNNTYGYVSRDYSGLKNNYISVNQIGYYTGGRKVAVLGDNSGDILHDASAIKLAGAVEFEVVNAESGKAVFKGKSTAPVKDKGSGDNVCKIDFSEFTEPGRYFIRSGDYRSQEFEIGDDIYSSETGDLFTNSLNFFYQSRSDMNVEEKYITSGEKSELAHKTPYHQEKAYVQTLWKDDYTSEKEVKDKYRSSEITTKGGWFESGDHYKSMISGGMAVWTLQNLFEVNALSGNANLSDGSGAVVIPENGNGMPDILDEAAYELDWMKQMKVPENDPAWGEKAAGMYLHEMRDYKWGGIADSVPAYELDLDDWYNRIAKPPTFAATLSYAACAAQGARLWEQYDEDKADEYYKSALEAFEAYEKAYYEPDMTPVSIPNRFGEIYCDETIPAESIREDSMYAKGSVVTSERNSYGDRDVSDEAYWAACELFISASERGDKENAEKFLKELESFEEAYTVPEEANFAENSEDGALASYKCGSMTAVGTMSLALHKDLLSDEAYNKICESLTAAADEYIYTEESEGYGVPLRGRQMAFGTTVYSVKPGFVLEGYTKNSNSMVLNNGIIMAYAYLIDGDKKYADGAAGAMDYLLGTNPKSVSYITGYGDYAVKNPLHSFWAGSIDHSYPTAPDGVLSSGPNAWVNDPFIKSLGFVTGQSNPAQQCFVDSAESWSTNDTTLTGNASLAWMTSFMQGAAKNALTSGSEPEPTVSPEPTESPAPTASPKLIESPAPTVPPETTTSPIPTASPDQTAEPVIISEDTRGDINCDGKLDITDLSALAIALVDREELKGQANKNADIDKDGEVTLADLARLRQYLSKKIESFDK